MNIIVCVKIVQGELNPFDAGALECALEVAEKGTQNGEPSTETMNVTILGMGPKTWFDPMMKLTRIGTQAMKDRGTFRAILLSDSAFAGSDTLATSRILASAIQKLGMPDWIFCGRQTIDGDTAQVGPELATLLNVGVVTNCMEIPNVFDKKDVQVVTRCSTESISSPAVLSFERIRALRFPSIRSRPRTVEVWNRETLGIPSEMCGTAGSPTHVLKTFLSKHGQRRCQWITWDELPKIVENARNEKVLEAHKQKSVPYLNESLSEKSASPRFSCVYAVGHEVEAQARKVAETVIFVEKTSPHEIAETVKDAEVVLWNADAWGRRYAPQVAALLGTGLCADCIALETDGEKLFMYRPARSGEVLAKIECLTRPQMATLRTPGASADVILAGGRGVADHWEALETWGKTLHAELVASRALVDTGKVPYDFQVGLTGRNVSPKVYIAVGISGAVQHTCAIENTGTIIAINPDRDARIFEYADYGILEAFPPK